MRVLVSAGEPSGDRHAAALIRALRTRQPDATVSGVGGPAMRQAGAVLLEGLAGLAAMGLVESAGSLAHHLRLLRRLDREIGEGGYDLVILVDYPGLHLRVARAAARHGVPVLYYIAPQVWAWGAWRLGAIRRTIRRLAVILPFEEPFFRGHGIHAEFVGHPVRDETPPTERAAARQALGIASDVPVLALFPGSRPGDLDRHWSLFASAARLVRRAIPDVAVLVAAPGQATAGLRSVADARLVRAAADAAIVKSGTATLEAALAGLPMVVAYRMHPITHGIARRVAQVPYVSLVNLIAERAIVPELIQQAATPESLAASVLPLLDGEGSASRVQRAAFAMVRERLGGPGAADRAAALAVDVAR